MLAYPVATYSMESMQTQKSSLSSGGLMLVIPVGSRILSATVYAHADAGVGFTSLANCVAS